MVSLKHPAARRASAVVALGLAASVALAGCGGTDKKATGGDKSGPNAANNSAPAVWPLTGLPMKGSAPKHPVFFVKIPNTDDAYPQVGLSKADLVTEELVEGGITRLAVGYDSTIPELVGDVRSARTTDIGIAKPAHAPVIASGVSPYTGHSLDVAHVKLIQSGAGYFRDNSRRGPSWYSMMLHMRELVKTLKDKRKSTAGYLPWGSEQDFHGTAAAGSLSVTFSKGRTSQWKFQGGKYVNTNGFAPPSDQFKADTVLVIRTKQGVEGYKDPSGNTVPVSKYVGSGPAFIFHHGKMVRGTWSKADYGSQLRLSNASGSLKVPAGHTWIELIPADNQGHVSWGK